MLAIVSMLSILSTITVANAAQEAITTSCQIQYHGVDSNGDFIPESDFEGPSIEKLTFDVQKVKFKGFSLKASLAGPCSAADPASWSSCIPDTLNVVISKGGVISEVSVEIKALAENTEQAQAIALTKDNEKFIAICRLKMN